MSMYKMYQTDQDLEKKGVVCDFDGFRVTVARSGGANSRYQQRLEALTKPFRRAIQTETLSDKKSKELIQEAYAETIVLNWETEVEPGVWKVGIEGPDGELLPFNKSNVLMVFQTLPDLYTDIVELANKASLYKSVQLEEDSKN